MRFVLSILVNGIALWLTTLILSAGVRVIPYDGGPFALVVTYLLLGLVWGVVNATIGTFLRIVGFCFYIITLGLIALVVNGFLFWIVAWVSELMGFGLQVDNFWWAILAALILSIISALLGWATRQFTDRGSGSSNTSAPVRT